MTKSTFKNIDIMADYVYTVQRNFPSTKLEFMVVDDETYEQLFDKDPTHLYVAMPHILMIPIYSNYQYQVKQESKKYTQTGDK